MPVTKAPDERDIIMLPSGREANFKELHLDDYDQLADINAIENFLTDRIILIRDALAHLDAARSKHDAGWRIRAETALKFAIAYRHRCQTRKSILADKAKAESARLAQEMQKNVIEAAKLKTAATKALLQQTKDFQSEFVAAARNFLPPDLYSTICDMANARLSPHINKGTSKDEPQTQAPIHDNQACLGPMLDGPGS